MKPIARIALPAAHSRATRGLSATLLGVLLAWSMLSGCTSSDGKGTPNPACSGDACPAPTPPCAKDADCDAAEFCAQGVCKKDVCSQGTADCDAKTGELRVCADNGSRSDSAACAASKSCVADKKGATCQPWLCSPGQSSCTGDGKSTRSCADDGLSYGAQTECSKGTSCVSGKCVTITCTPNQLFCQNGSSFVCSGDGASATLQQTCDSVSFCEAESGQCRAQPCSPGHKTCVDQAVATCNAAGTGYDRVECALTEVCDSGSCVPAVCSPGEVYCDSAQVAKQCNQAGTATTNYTTCSAGTHCSAYNSTYATCSSNTCTPGADMCDGTRATVCKTDGTGAAPGGTDCALASGVCSAGRCKAQACTPNQRFCANGSVYLCSTDGAGSSLYSSCVSSTCNPATANCAALACTPNAASCSGNSVVQCDANGLTNVVVQSCTTTSQVCVAGKCQPTVCTPYAATCKNGNVYTCSSDGTADALSSVCGTGTFCGSGYCQTNVCTPGAPVCNGNGLSTCKTDGSGPVDAGTTCASGSVCDKGACKPTVCTPNGLFCSNGDVRQCNAQGDGSGAYQHCFSDTYCSNGACLADVCLNGAPYCSGEIFESCKADGSGPSDAGTDCAAGGQVCSIAGCATSIVETIAATGGSQYVTVVGEIIHTQKARKLTRVEIDGFSDSIIKNTIVYSSTDNVNFYLLASVPGSASVDFPPGFNDSGALSVELQANTYYLVGENLIYGAINYNDQGIGLGPLSFGTVLKSVYQNVTFAVPSSFVPVQSSLGVHMRLTTALP